MVKMEQIALARLKTEAPGIQALDMMELIERDIPMEGQTPEAVQLLIAHYRCLNIAPVQVENANKAWKEKYPTIRSGNTTLRLFFFRSHISPSSFKVTIQFPSLLANLIRLSATPAMIAADIDTR